MVSSSLLHHDYSLPGISLPPDPVTGEPLFRGAADSDGSTSAIHPEGQAAYQAPKWSGFPQPTFSRGIKIVSHNNKKLGSKPNNT